MLLKAGGFLIWAMKPDFTGFLLGFIAWGAEEAFCSGTTDALLFDALRHEKIQASYEAVAGTGELPAKTGIVAAMIAGGFLFERWPQLTLVLSAVPMVLAGVCVLFIFERRDRPPVRAVRTAPGSLRRIGQAVREAAAIPGLPLLVAMGSLVGATYGSVDEFDSLYGTLLGIPVSFIGLWGAARFLVEGIGAATSGLLRRALGLYRPRMLALWILAAGLVLLLGTLLPKPALAPLYVAYYAMIAAALVVYEGALQRTISGGRATVASLASFLSTGAGMGLGILFGFVAQRWGLSALFHTGAAITMIAAAGYALLTGRRLPPDF
jgi:hypothetical protein